MIRLIKIFKAWLRTRNYGPTIMDPEDSLAKWFSFPNYYKHAKMVTRLNRESLETSRRNMELGNKIMMMDEVYDY